MDRNLGGPLVQCYMKSTHYRGWLSSKWFQSAELVGGFNDAHGVDGIFGLLAIVNHKILLRINARIEGT
jgi:hypothetical protein